jgi:hypothetical protein
MRRFALKALVAAFTLNRAEKKHIDWDRTVLIFSTWATIGLVMLYAFGKATSRWEFTSPFGQDGLVSMVIPLQRLVE